MKTIQKWWNKYRREPTWIDNWDTTLDRPIRLIIRDKHGMAIARDCKVRHRTRKRQWELQDYCKYCTSFLEESEDDQCVKCGIKDAIHENNCVPTSENTQQNIRGELNHD